jgi:enamine deaminase RidA (YjgF/YER057c/UK114 family)
MTAYKTSLLLLFLSVILLTACPSPTQEDQKLNASAENATEEDIEAKLEEMGITLPTPPTPVANYVTAVSTGNLVFLSGHGPLQSDGTNITGKVGTDLSIEEGKEAARVTAINLLASLKAEIGDLNKVKRIVKVLGMVNAAPDFTQHPQVINGCSDLMVELFGEKIGKHARAAVGMGSLPSNIAVEIEMVVEVGE